MLIYGINPVLEALRAGRVERVRISERASGRVAELARAAERGGVTVRRVSAADLDRAVGGARHRHQGVVAELQEAGAVDVRDLLAGAKGAPLIVVRDGIEDPH